MSICTATICTLKYWTITEEYNCIYEQMGGIYSLVLIIKLHIVYMTARLPRNKQTNRKKLFLNHQHQGS